MSKHADYMAGWIDTTIHDFLSEIDEPTSSMGYALITSLDSSTDIPALLEKSKHLSALQGKHQVVGTGIVVSTRQLLLAQKKNRVFFGFDEVWFFPHADISPKPDGLAIVGPEPIGAQEMEEHDEWLRSNNCSLGLGDGAGMNFCLKVRGVARFIVEAFNEANPPLAKDQREIA
jgi:hypothetical protein